MGNAVNGMSRGFAGRVLERRRLVDTLSASAQGQPLAVLVHGEAGVGKTRLVREVTEAYRAGGGEVLWGTCVHFGAASVPFAPVVQALDRWAQGVDPSVRSSVLEGADELSKLLPSIGVGSADVPSSRLLPVVDRVVQRIAKGQPTVLVIDDLQWADVSSLDVLAYLITGLRAQNLALTGDPYGIDLTVSRFGERYHLKWNPASVAVRSARGGELVVEGAAEAKPRSLTADELSRGGLIFPGGDQALRFHLSLFVREHATYTETVETQKPAH